MKRLVRLAWIRLKIIFHCQNPSDFRWLLDDMYKKHVSREMAYENELIKRIKNHD